MTAKYSRLVCMVSIALCSQFSFSQVGIGTTNPNPDAILDVNSTTAGLLLPRLALTATTNPTPLSTDVAGMVVYNTATAGDVTPGFYYNDGTNWVRLGTRDWKLSGNAGTNSATDFIGTTDAQDLVFRTDNMERARILASNGNFGIGISPGAVKLEVDGGAGNAIYGHSNGVGGYLGRESNITIGLPGATQTINGAGVYANNPSAGYVSVYAQSTDKATVAAGVQYSSVWMANYSYVDNSDVGFNPSGSYIQLNKNESTTGGTHASLKALSTREVGGNPGFTVGAVLAATPGAISGTQTEDAYGVIAQATKTNGEFAIGGQFLGIGNGGGYTVTIADDLSNRKVIGTGSVSEVIPTKKHGRITLTCPESPEYWYQDYGTVTMVNGKAVIKIDPILSDIIVVDKKNPVRVTCTPYQMPYFNGVTIMKYDKNTVVIQELNGGTHSGELQYELVVKPKTNYGEGRFPQAYGPYFTKGLDLPAAKTANQHDRSKVFEWPSDWEVYNYQDVAKEYLNGNKLRQKAYSKEPQK